ncbi:leucine-rich repeat protein [Ruminococcus sp. XPD3002]|uniref:leucine-rich repeat protein n=1 Tax=Ruminococcus sp. XPD3002 TaxID=1452269 RepID=UPI00094D2661
MMKKKISLLTSAVMLSAALMNGSAYAEEDTPEVKTIVIGGIIYSYTVDENYSWYDDETEKFVTIVGAQNAKGEVKLPLSLEDYPVTNVGSKAFFNNTDITSVKLPDTLETIGSNAFAGCISLEKVENSKGVSNYGQGAFMGCTSLKTIDLSGAEDIYDSAFSSCISLTDVNFSDKLNYIRQEAFFGCSGLSVVTIPKDTYIEYNALGKYYDLRSGYYKSDENFLILGERGSHADSYADNYSISFIDPKKDRRGDVDKDGFVSASDSSAVLQEYARLSTAAEGTFTSYQIYMGDFDENGRIDAGDASAILAEYARLSTLGDEPVTTTSTTVTTSSTTSTTTVTTTITTTVPKTTAKPTVTTTVPKATTKAAATTAAVKSTTKAAATTAKAAVTTAATSTK